MQKTKLQELCQSRRWQLPEYSTTKEGPGHELHFQATVTVNGLSFHSSSPARSAKQAQNEAAKLALDQLSAAPTTASASTSSSASVPSPPPLASCSEMRHLYKNLLQTYAQKRNLSLPIYSWERVGPPHASRFKCNVTIDGQTYESQGFFSTLVEGEHAAAKVALMSLSPNGIEEDESAYKNLLQEMAQKNGNPLPVYNTSKIGQSHPPTFVSTVEVGGQVFAGLEARTKKQAELSAAKSAYKALKHRNSSQNP